MLVFFFLSFRESKIETLLDSKINKAAGIKN